MNHLLCTMDNLGGVPENDGVGAITWGVRSLQRAGSHAYWEESFLEDSGSISAQKKPPETDLKTYDRATIGSG